MKYYIHRNPTKMADRDLLVVFDKNKCTNKHLIARMIWKDYHDCVWNNSPLSLAGGVSQMEIEGYTQCTREEFFTHFCKMDAEITPE